MPSIRHQLVPPNHHSQSRAYEKHIPAYDGSYLHHGRCSRCCRRVYFGSRWKAKPLHHRLPLHYDCRLHNVSFPNPSFQNTTQLRKFSHGISRLGVSRPAIPRWYTPVSSSQLVPSTRRSLVSLHGLQTTWQAATSEAQVWHCRLVLEILAA